MRSPDVMREWSLKLLPVFLLLIPLSGVAQDRKQLETKRNKLIEQIEYTSKLLKQSEKTKTATLEDYKLLQKQMRVREELLGNLRKELEKLDDELDVYTDSIGNLEKEIERQEVLIRRISQEQYLWRTSQSEWAFVLSSASWRTALMRWNLLSQLRINAKRQIESYQETRAEMEALIEQRKIMREDQSVLMADAEKNVKILASEANVKKASLSQLEKQEKNLRSELERKNKERINLNKAIEAAILAELKAAEAGKENLRDAPEIARLSKSFEENKGKLPWPLSKGVITGHFGKHPHPTLKQVTIVNNGIDIRTEPGAQAKALFDGKVVGVKYIPGYEQMIIVQHGNYYSVYSRLDAVKVEKGQQVKTGQVLGTVWQNQNSGIFELHLEIWNGKSQMDPEAWLASR